MGHVPSQDDIDLSVREILDYVRAMYTSLDEDQAMEALALWRAVYGTNNIELRVEKFGEIDTSEFEILVTRRLVGATLVCWQLLRFMSKETGRSVEDVLTLFEQEISREP
jgi:hypothetical protein